MKVSTLLVLSASTLAICQSPSSCKGGGKRNGADFVLVDQGVNTHLGPLSKMFANANKQVNVSKVFDDGNHRMSGATTQLSWEKTKDFNDVDTKKWYPQGISSTADAAEVGTYDGKDGWLVSWYSDESHQVRISFVNKATKKYRHALLVNPSADDDFQGVGIHAGGIMWYGDTLWVVDTSNGIRVFDMANVWEVGSGDKVGKISAGKYAAAGYKYVIPQIRFETHAWIRECTGNLTTGCRWYKWTPSFPFRFSYISLDRTASPDRLMVGEYQPDEKNPIRMVQFELDYTTRTLRTGADKKTAKGVWAFCHDILRTQGAVQANGRIYVSRSNGANTNGDIWGWIPGKGAAINKGMVPPGPEDLSYDKRGKKMYTVTEHPGKRYLVTLDSTRIKFP